MSRARSAGLYRWRRTIGSAAIIAEIKMALTSHVWRRGGETGPETSVVASSREQCGIGSIRAGYFASISQSQSAVAALPAATSTGRGVGTSHDRAPRQSLNETS